MITSSSANRAACCQRARRYYYLLGRACPFITARPFSVYHKEFSDTVHSYTRQQEDVIATTNRRLLDVPVGSLSASAWKEGHDALRWWSTHRPESQNCAKAFVYSCRLMERLLQERESLSRRLEKMQGAMDASTVLEHCYSLDSAEMLRTIVSTWHNNPQIRERELLNWVEDLIKRFDIQPCNNVATLLETGKNGTDVKVQVLSHEASAATTLRSNRGAETSTTEKGKHVQAPELTDNDRLVGRVLLNFVREWKGADLDYEDIRERIDRFMAETDNKQPRTAYMLVLKSWEEAAQREPDVAAKHADSVLYEMLTSYLADANESSKPSRECFSSVISVHTSNDNPEKTDRILQDMLILYNRTNDIEFCPNRRCFLSVLYSYFCNQAHCKDMVNKADHILRQMLDLAESTDDTSLIPPSSVFEHMLTLWARSYEKDAGERVEVVLLRMQNLYDNNKLNFKPSLLFFELLMQSWANSHQDKAAIRVEKIQSFVKKNLGKLGNIRDEDISPTFGYLSLIQAWSRWNASEPLLAVEKTEQYFHEMRVYFDTDYVSSLDIILAYKARINSYGNIRNARKGAQRAQAALDELEELRRNGIIKRQPDATFYGAVASAWARAGKPEMVKKIIAAQPENQVDTVMYNCLLQAYARSNSSGVPKVVESILSKMEEMSSNGRTAVRPNIRTYGIVMTCLANSRDPDTIERAEQYLRYLKETYENTGDINYRPNTKIYTTVMQAFSRSKKPASVEKAEALLAEMNHLADQGHEHARADVVAYTMVLKALRNADIPDKASRVQEILRVMQQYGIKTDECVEHEIRKINSSL